MKFSDEQLMAYADGELDELARRAVEEAMRSDPQIAARVAEHQALRNELGAAFAGVLHEPIPSRLLDTAQASSGDKVTDLAAARAAKQERELRGPVSGPVSGRRSWTRWAALAASLALGVLVGRTLQSPDNELVATANGGLVAAGPLADALSRQTGVDAGNSGISIAATFRAQSGAYCRAFSVRDESLAGFACREHDAWRVHTLMRTSRPDGETYRTAGSALPAPLVQAIESTMVGDPLDAQEEAAARDRDWRN